jgi:hypothetical protein
MAQVCLVLGAVRTFSGDVVCRKPGRLPDTAAQELWMEGGVARGIVQWTTRGQEPVKAVGSIISPNEQDFFSCQSQQALLYCPSLWIERPLAFLVIHSDELQCSEVLAILQHFDRWFVANDSSLFRC